MSSPIGIDSTTDVDLPSGHAYPHHGFSQAILTNEKETPHGHSCEMASGWKLWIKNTALLSLDRFTRSRILRTYDLKA